MSQINNNTSEYYPWLDKNIKFHNIINTCTGKKCWIYGCGPTAKQQPITDDHIIFGVNDIENHLITPDYLVLIDTLQSFQNEPLRQKTIYETNAKMVFTHLKNMKLLKDPFIVHIGLNNRRDQVKLDYNHLDISYSSVFVAVGIAYQMGFSEITVAGCDLSLIADHHLATTHTILVKHFDLLREEMLKRRPDMKIISASDPTGVLKNWPQRDKSTNSIVWA